MRAIITYIGRVGAAGFLTGAATTGAVRADGDTGVALGDTAAIYAAVDPVGDAADAAVGDVAVAWNSTAERSNISYIFRYMHIHKETE